MGAFHGLGQHGRFLVLGAFVLLSLLWVLSLSPIPQDLAYHAFADRRTFAGIPNFNDVVSSLPFVIVGLAGVRTARRAGIGPARPAWVMLFAGIAWVGGGSGYYHWSPDNGSLFWDRLPMTVGFTALLVALVGEYVGAKWVPRLLIPAVVVGIGAVLHWHVNDDLRLYAWVQFMPFGVVALLAVLFRSPFTHSWRLVVALGWYAAAKVCEQLDAAIFDASGAWISGHSLKHLLAAVACWTLVGWLDVRHPRH